MRYAGVIYEDTAAAPGLCVSVYLQGCPFHCKGCHNPETWDVDGGMELTRETIDRIMEKINAYGVKHSLCILGGEPLAPFNLTATFFLLKEYSEKYPGSTAYVWTGYTFDELSDITKQMLYDNNVILIDGRFDIEHRDVTLKMRGSPNQRIIDVKRSMDENKIILFNE